MILGIYFNQRNIKKLYKGKLRSKMNIFAQEAINEEVQLLVFSPSSVNWICENINGLIYNSVRRKWETAIFPFPDVIYDRATFPDKEKEIGKLVRHRLNKEYKIPFLNTKSYFNKLETYKVLSVDSAIINYLPDTVKYTHPYQLIDFMDKYNSIYIKESGGKLGRNIFKLQRVQDELYTLSYQSRGNRYHRNFTLQEIHNELVANKLLGKTILIQQGIDVAALNEHPFDIRVLVQKSGMMNWIIVDKSIRLAAPGSVVTNVSSGGEVKKYSDVVPILFSNSEEISKEIDMLLLKVCNCLENTYGTLAELGIDIAIDSNGKVWLIEVNGKPSKLCIYHSGNLELISKTCNNIVEYSKELYNQSKELKTLYGGIESGRNQIQNS